MPPPRKVKRRVTLESMLLFTYYYRESRYGDGRLR
jgi:hypothetical protein